MSHLLATLVVAVLLGSKALGKTVTGLFQSEVARQQSGQFITKFMYQGNGNGNVNVNVSDVLALTCHFSREVYLGTVILFT